MAEPFHEQITTALDVERFELDLFRSKTLWLPNRARGVFGGQVISQALVAATQTVDPAFGLHPFTRLRDGRSYVTRAVKALQSGRTIFFMTCSYQKPEPWQPVGQWPMPQNVPAPSACVLEEDNYEKLAQEPGLHPKIKAIYRDFATERTRSPIAVKVALENDSLAGGATRHMYWLKARDIPKYEPHYQKCILAYMSDLYLLGAARRTLGLKRFGKGPQAVSMTSTIDHTIAFYDDAFDCGDWLLYVMVSPRAASGRAIVYGQIYTQGGSLVAVTTQEGVVRADIRGPDAKL
uniref:Acyl-coenzyme A thioesterase 8 n=1 Tax=Mycena chlorophos TaxID=658473 RepID=A0ABQ0LFD0_MYCCL|nr:acyl-coenzyme A thioesterase 8 [Mycena chlorophos]